MTINLQKKNDSKIFKSENFVGFLLRLRAITVITKVAYIS